MSGQGQPLGKIWQGGSNKAALLFPNCGIIFLGRKSAKYAERFAEQFRNKMPKSIDTKGKIKMMR